MTSPSDKRRAMLIYLRDLADGRAGYEAGASQVLRETGDVQAADDRARAALDWHAIYLMLACILSEYEQGQKGQYGVPKAVTNILSAGAGAYLKGKAA